MPDRPDVVLPLPEQPGELLKKTTTLLYVAVDHLHALDGQRLLLHTFLGTRDEDALRLRGGKASRRVGQRLSVALAPFQVLDDARDVVVCARIALPDDLLVDLGCVVASMREAFE